VHKVLAFRACHYLALRHLDCLSRLGCPQIQLQVKGVRMSMKYLPVVLRAPLQVTVPPGLLCHLILGMGELSLKVEVV